ncbi:unnamed protein product [Discosporangium mesarthrocarpum]
MSAEHMEEISSIHQAFSELISMPEFDISEAKVAIADDIFIQDLCSRFQAGVSRETKLLRSTLYWLYSTFPNKRGLLRRKMGSILSQFANTPNRSTHVAQLLEVLREVIKGFPQTLSEVHIDLLKSILLPLHRPNEMAVWRDQIPLLGTYHEELVKCMVPFFERQPSLAEVAISAVVDAWPGDFQSNTPKEVLLLHELSMLLRYVPVEGLGCVSSMVTPKICGSLRLENSRVVERALFLFQDEHFLDLVKDQSKSMMLPLVSALLRGGQPFWNPTVTKMTAHVLETLHNIDSEEFSAVCESLWGGTAPSADSNSDKCMVQDHQEDSKMHSSGPLLSPGMTSMKVAMGEWRPPKGGKDNSAPRSSAATSAPPVTITGVAPWAFQVPRPLSVIPSATVDELTGEGGEGDNAGGASMVQRQKRPLPGAHVARGKGIDQKSTLEGVEEELPMIREDMIEGHDRGGTHQGGGVGLRKVQAFIEQLKPQKRHRTGPSWQELQMEPTPTLLPNLRFHDLVFGQELGHGSFSSVKYARQIVRGAPRTDWPEYAVKIIGTERIEELRYERSVVNEIASLQVLSHPGIARLVSSFRWRDGAYLVLEYASRGDLHTHLIQNGSLSEASTRFVTGEVTAALCSVHECGFVFGDLKPENILITESGHIKVTDFGACRAVTGAGKAILKGSRNVLRELRDGDWRVAAGLPANPVYSRPLVRGGTRDLTNESKEGDENSEGEEDNRAEGTAAYLPPEVARGGTPGMAADAWALGCVIYQCVVGRPPVFAETDEEIMGKVVSFAPGDEDQLPDFVSGECKALVAALMEPNPEIRLTVHGSAEQAFFVGSGIDVFSLHHQKPLELVAGSIKPAPNAAWSRRQNSMIWAPMPQEYRCDEISTEMSVVEETELERGERFSSCKRIIPAVPEV